MGGAVGWFGADRESGDAIEAAMPTIRLMAVENRRFLGRAASYVSAQGVRQFLDIGTGLPAPGGVAEVVDPSSRILHVDNDPLVTQQSGDRTYVEADLRSPRTILGHPTLRETLDLTRPVGLMLVAVLHFIRDDENPRAIVRTLIDALPSGSYVVASHATWEYQPESAVTRLRALNPDGRFVPRPGSELGSFFDGLELVEPGVVSVAHWRAPGPRPQAEDVGCNGLVARVL